MTSGSGLVRRRRPCLQALKTDLFTLFHMSEAVPHDVSSRSSFCAVCPIVRSRESDDNC